MLYTLEQTLRLLHPFMPYISEEIWHTLHKAEEALATQSWPFFEKSYIDKNSEKEMGVFIDLVYRIRNSRAIWNIDPQVKAAFLLQPVTKRDALFLKENQSTIEALAKINIKLADPKNSTTTLSKEIKYKIDMRALGSIDVAKEEKRIFSQIENYNLLQKNLKKRLKNKDFLKKAPREVIEKEGARLTDIETKIKELTVNIRDTL